MADLYNHIRTPEFIDKALYWMKNAAIKIGGDPLQEQEKQAVSSMILLGEIDDDDLAFIMATNSTIRQKIIDDFRGGKVRYLVNVNVLTTGFDAPNVDAICLLRSTLSPALYVQMIGRGMRACQGKTDCLVLDYGENAVRHGPIDMIFPERDLSRKGKKDQERRGIECEKCQCIFEEVNN